MITKEAIEAGRRITLSSLNMTAGECLHETEVREILEAALPFLSSPGKDGGQEVVAWIDDGTLRAGSEATAHRVVTDEQKRNMPASISASFSTPLYTRPQPASTALVERLTKALEEISDTRCVHDMGFDREVGPLGCSLGDKCVCVGLCSIASRALANPTLTQVEVARVFNVNPGRVSEAVSGRRK